MASTSSSPGVRPAARTSCTAAVPTLPTSPATSATALATATATAMSWSTRRALPAAVSPSSPRSPAGFAVGDQPHPNPTHRRRHRAGDPPPGRDPLMSDLIRHTALPFSGEQPQARDQLAPQRPAASNVKRLVDRLVGDPHRLILGEVVRQPIGDLFRAPRGHPPAI